MNVLAALAQECCNRLTGAPADYDGLVQDVRDAPIVLLGEATHGSHEFYRRALKYRSA